MSLNMDQNASTKIAATLVEAMNKLNEVVEYLRDNVPANERAPFNKAIGEVFGIVTDEMYSRLVRFNPDLHDLLFRGLPADAPDKFFRASSGSPSSEK